MSDPSGEHLEFIHQLVANVRAMVGDDKMVAGIGEETNGCYAVLICINPLPPSLVMMGILNMLAEKVLQDMAVRHNNESFTSPSKAIN